MHTPVGFCEHDDEEPSSWIKNGYLLHKGITNCSLLTHYYRFTFSTVSWENTLLDFKNAHSRELIPQK